MTPKIRFLPLAALCLVLLSAGCSLGGQGPAQRRAVVTVEGTTTELLVQVSDAHVSRNRDLMHRPEVQVGYGMLFTFAKPTAPQEWHHDTLSALDIAWIRNGKVIGVDTMQACTAVQASDCDHIAAPGDIDSALEAPSGTFTGVARGARVTVTDKAPSKS